MFGLGYGGTASAACWARNELAVYHGRTSTVGTQRRSNESLNLGAVGSAPPQIGTRLADK